MKDSTHIAIWRNCCDNSGWRTLVSVGEHKKGGSEGAAIPHHNCFVVDNSIANAIMDLPDGSLQLLTHITR
jgi:hypothetical protein